MAKHRAIIESGEHHMIRQAIEELIREDRKDDAYRYLVNAVITLGKKHMDRACEELEKKGNDYIVDMAQRFGIKPTEHFYVGASYTVDHALTSQTVKLRKKADPMEGYVQPFNRLIDR